MDDQNLPKQEPPEEYEPQVDLPANSSREMYERPSNLIADTEEVSDEEAQKESGAADDDDDDAEDLYE